MVSLALSLWLAHAFPLVDPDEGRNAEVAREMAESRDFLIPQLAGMPYLDKPPALFWGTALAIGLLGRSPWAARLPAAIAAALVVWLVCDLAAKRAGDAFALRASLLLLSAPLFAVMSAYVIFDMPLALCVTAVWTRIVDEVDRGPTVSGRLVMFGAVALGILIKGPVMLAWAVGGSLGATLALRSRAPLRWLAWAAGWAIVAVTAGGWFALASVRHPEYPHYALLEESLERLGSGSFHRDQPLWFVPAVLIGGALPWSLATPWHRDASPAGRIALGFVVFAALFFTASRSKLVTYLLPALPPLAWLAAEAWSSGHRAARGAWVTAALYLALAASLVVAGAMLGESARAALGEDGARAFQRLSIALAALALLAAGFAARRPALGFVPSLAFTPVVLFLIHPALLRRAEAESGAPLARAIAAAAPSARVRYEYCYSPGTDFLLGRTSALVSPRGVESTSNYQVRYRKLLIERGRWTAVQSPDGTAAAGVIVRSARDSRPAPAGMVEFYRDRRFAAYRAAGAGGLSAGDSAGRSH